MRSKLELGETVEVSVRMATATGVRNISLSGEIVDLSQIQNGDLDIKLEDGSIRTARASTVVDYKREISVIGILFSPDMVTSLRASRKTQTRRLATSPLSKRHVDDLLYVREAFHVSGGLDPIRAGKLFSDCDMWFPADGGEKPAKFGRFRPGMHMPRSFSRISLEVIGVRVEPLQNITPADAIEEGIFPIRRANNVLAAAAGRPMSGGDVEVTYRNYADPDGPGLDPVESFRSLWNSLHSAEGETWEDNPDVLRLEFAVEAKNVDTLIAERKGGAS